MADKLHDVVKLLLARMESHPEEFNGDLVDEDSREARWWRVIREVREYGTEAEREVIDAVIRKIKLQYAHEMMMDELLNGDDRRRKAQEEYEAGLQRYAARNMGSSLRSAITPALQQMDVQTQIEQMEAYRNTYNQMTLTAVTQPATLNIGGESITADIIKKLKKVAGL